ncbi:hypothetical protein BDF19DRAFT_420559 [Syncephalis fuscata]|nr:hypothetical protein BDF19DRAFT_420559 [Syncephalis fuscata]
MQLGKLFTRNSKQPSSSTVELAMQGVETDSCDGPPTYEYNLDNRNQFRALLYKTVATQKHQWMISAGCAIACPALVVGIGGIIALTAARNLNATNVPLDFDFAGNPPNASTLNYAGFYPTDLFMASGVRVGCAHWFGENYPFLTLIQCNNSQTNGSSEHDTTYLPKPIGGWASWSPTAKPVQGKDGQLRSLYSSIPQYRPWSLYQTANGVDVGARPPSGNSGGNSSTSTSGASARSIIGNNNNTSQDAVYFVKENNIDDVLMTKFTEAADLLDRNTPVDNNFPYPPFGAILFDKINNNQNELDFTLQMGSVRRFLNDAKISKAYPSQGLRQLVAYTQYTVSTKYQGRYTITPGIQAMPHTINPSQQGDVSAMIGRFLFPFAISFLMPLFVYTLVKEKEDRILMMMHMSGLSSRVYYLSHYLHFLLQQVIASIVFIVVGAALQMSFFTRTNPLVYILLMLLWSHVQVCFAFFLASLFNSSRRALILTYLFVTLSVIVGSMSSVIFKAAVPYFWYIHPSFAMYHAVHLITVHAAFTNRLQPYTFGNWNMSDPLSVIFGILFIESIILSLLTLANHHVLYKVVSGLFGRRKQVDAPTFVKPNAVIKDVNALNERKKIENGTYDAHCNVVVKNIEKTFAAGNTAVNDVSFSVQPNIVFGLLGPNGAGKSTLLHMLTGLIEPTSGTALIAGHDITKQMGTVHTNIGVCPQHDIHWGDLTPMEHMLFYARLRGIPKEHEVAEATRALKEVQLLRQSHQQAQSLSGGEKRRLSIGISLLGNSKVVFLDEPTTGLDPQVRRVIWRIILNAKRHRTVILTTHSMEEADTLCSQIGIMASGALRCIGNQVYLKKEYGSGYRLSLAATPHKLETACRFVESILPRGWKRIDRSKISEVFLNMQKNKDALGIDDWGLSQTSLEDVFMNIVSQVEDEDPSNKLEEV